MTTFRTNTETSSSLSGPTDVLATAHGTTNRKNDPASYNCDVVRQEQAASGVLVQHSQEQVKREREVVDDVEV